MSKTQKDNVYLEGDTIEDATLRLIAAGAFDGITAQMRVPASSHAAQDHRYVLTNLDRAYAEFEAHQLAVARTPHR